MAHPNEDLVRTGYERFLAGDLAAPNDPFADDAVRRAPGKHQLAGDFHGKDEIPAAFAGTLELTGGTVSSISTVSSPTTDTRSSW